MPNRHAGATRTTARRLTLAEWYTERDWLLQTYLPQRSDIVLGQLRNAGLYPATDAPAFSQHGGQVPGGAEIEVSAPAGLIYYTLDGSDPRMIGGQPNPNALVFDTNNNISTATLVPTGAAWRYLDNGSDQGTAWREPGFNDASWESGNAQLGYGDGDEQTVVSYGAQCEQQVHHDLLPAYIRSGRRGGRVELDSAAPARRRCRRLPERCGSRAVEYADTAIAYTTLAGGEHR